MLPLPLRATPPRSHAATAVGEMAATSRQAGRGFEAGSGADDKRLQPGLGTHEPCGEQMRLAQEGGQAKRAGAGRWPGKAGRRRKMARQARLVLWADGCERAGAGRWAEKWLDKQASVVGHGGRAKGRKSSG